MEFTAAQLAGLLDGRLEGDPDVLLNDLSQIENGARGSVCFLSDLKYAEYLYSTKASAALVSHDYTPKRELPKTLTLIRVNDPRLAVGKILELYHQYKNSQTGIHPTAVIEKSAKIGTNVFVGAHVYIGHHTIIGNNCRFKSGVKIGNGVQIGDNCSFHYNVVIEDDSVIGNYVTIQPGAIIGSEGFGFQPNRENNYQKLYHIGNVILEDHVEVGSNTTIDRGTLGSTIIRKGVKLDNLIQIGHNVEIGRNTVIAAQTGVAGSTVVGKNCMLGGQVGLAGHQKIADGVKLAAKSGVQGNITQENGVFQGAPAFPIMDYRKSYVFFRKLPQMALDINDLKDELKKIKS